MLNQSRQRSDAEPIFLFYMLTKVKLSARFVQFQKIVVPLQRFF